MYTVQRDALSGQHGFKPPPGRVHLPNNYLKLNNSYALDEQGDNSGQEKGFEVVLYEL